VIEAAGRAGDFDIEPFYRALGEQGGTLGDGTPNKPANASMCPFVGLSRRPVLHHFGSRAIIAGDAAPPVSPPASEELPSVV
jgi:hypothetical protein